MGKVIPFPLERRGIRMVPVLSVTAVATAVRHPVMAAGPPLTPEALAAHASFPFEAGSYELSERLAARLGRGGMETLWRDAMTVWEAAQPVPVRADPLDQAETIRLLKQSLKLRSGKAWSVRAGRGSVHGWLTISCRPSSADKDGCMPVGYRRELAVLLGLELSTVPAQGVVVSPGRWGEFLRRAQGGADTPVIPRLDT